MWKEKDTRLGLLTQCSLAEEMRVGHGSWFVSRRNVVGRLEGRRRAREPSLRRVSTARRRRRGNPPRAFPPPPRAPSGPREPLRGRGRRSPNEGREGSPLTSPRPRPLPARGRVETSGACAGACPLPPRPKWTVARTRPVVPAADPHPQKRVGFDPQPLDLPGPTLKSPR